MRSSGLRSCHHILQSYSPIGRSAKRRSTNYTPTEHTGFREGRGGVKEVIDEGEKETSEHGSFDRIAHFPMIAEKNVVKRLIVHLLQSQLSVYDEKNLYSCHEAVFK